MKPRTPNFDDPVYHNQFWQDQMKRGYYSELASSLQKPEDRYMPELCAKRKTKFLLYSKADRFAPRITNLPQKDRLRRLLPQGRWTTYSEEDSIQFPFETFVPKLQFLHIVLPKQLPRLVKIERLRRKFLSSSIRKLLMKGNIQPHLLLPPSCYQLTDSEKYALHNKYPLLPLDIFDNDAFDSRTPEEWINLGRIEDKLYPCPGLAFIPRDPDKPFRTHEQWEQLDYIFEWTNVAIESYNPGEIVTWNLMTLDGTQRRFVVPRIRLLFKAEDPEVFLERVKFALRLRTEIENNIRYNLYIDCLILDHLPAMPTADVSRVIRLTISSNQVKHINKKALKIPMTEMEMLYKRCNAELEMRKLIEDNPKKYSFVRPARKEYYELVPQYGRYPCSMLDFEGTLKFIEWYSLYVLAESVTCMHLVVDECLRVESMCFFTSNYGRMASLEEFDAAQQHSTMLMLGYLTISWLNQTAHAIRMSFRDVGKGWFNINENTWEYYEVSKLSRFMMLVRLRMQSALRSCIESSMHMFVSMCETPCLCTYWCEDDYVWDESDLLNTPFHSSTTTLFHLSLLMSENGPYYTTDLDKFDIVIQRLFREMLYRCHFIHQVHPLIMMQLVFERDLSLTSIGLIESPVLEYQRRLKFAYEKALIPLKAYCKQYEVYIDIFMLEVGGYVELFRNEKHSASETRQEIQKHYDAKQDIIHRLPQYINIGPFSINVDTLKQCLVSKLSDLMSALLTMFAEEIRVVVDDIIVVYNNVMRKLAQKPNSIEHIYEIREWMEGIDYTLRTQDENLKRVLTDYEVLDVFFRALDDEDFAALWECVGWPYAINKQIETTDEFLLEELDKFWKIHMQDEQNLLDRIDMFTQQCMALTLQDDFSKVHEIAIDIKKAWKAMKESQEWGRTLNNRQKLFLQPVTPFADLQRLVKEFEPYRNLWVTASDFLKSHEVWFDNPLIYVDVDSIESIVNDYYRTIVKCVRTFADLPKVQTVALETRNLIDEFRPLIPIILAVKNPGMQERHWEEFMQKAGIEVTMDEGQTFQMCLDQGMAEHAELIASIGELACKEHTIQLTMSKMQGEWDTRKLELTPYKNTGTFILKISDETLQMLDEHLLQTQQISFSPFKAAFETEIEEWGDKLKLCQTVLEEWIECQKEWMYLEPIFTSEDITRQLPMESKKYGSMERIWRRIMLSVIAMPKIMVLCPDTRLLDSIREARHLLAVVMRGLAEYMENKRLRFPRFFFLSDDELLEILAQARNPRAVQPHLRKCFENIAKVTFERDMKITEMHSSEGEMVPLRYQFYPKGNVEQWLLLLEDTMKNTVRLTLVSALRDLEQRPRSEWVLLWAGQIVLAATQTMWTRRVEASLVHHALPDYYNVMLEELDELRTLVKGELTAAHRQMLCALIVIEVHARDVTRQLLEQAASSGNVRHFDWMRQLRYYEVVHDSLLLEEREDMNKKDEDENESNEDIPEIYQNENELDTSAYYRQFSQNRCDVRALNASFPYQNEYLGNSGRLVITPLTDRCYLTLMCAIHLKFGGAPAGPAGTGKTETTKDLAKALAVQCVVFNCSDQLDFMAMGKFFKGLAASGAWACFDEFNRIDIEVLSVVAQQVVSIQKAQMQRLERFMFEGAMISLKPSCAVFITMNPGYAGRTELPDNLKALFRPISMMVPDYALIAEISLFSFGFYDAQSLARKITTALKLSSEQLSVQDHYDFGMRTVKTVITVAGNLMQQMPNMDERQIVLRSLRDVNVPKFLYNDLQIFNGIMSDLFPKIPIPIVSYGVLELSIRNLLVKTGYDNLDSFVAKIIQLYETTVVRHGLMIVGPAGVGKTKCYEVLRDAITSARGKLSPDGTNFTPVHTFVLNPKAITMGQLYGEFDAVTHEWTDGILSSLIRAGIAVEDSDKRWYIFDGPVDAVWIENMNTVLDDNKKLCLSSGEIMKMTDHQRMIFEVADLAVASPATVSRCGMVYADVGVVGLPPLVGAWLKNAIPSLLADNIRKQLEELIAIYLLPAILFLRANLVEVVRSIDSALVLKFLEMLDYRFRPLNGKDDRPPPPTNKLALMPQLVPCWVVFSCVWSVGATCDYNGRSKFSQWMRQTMNENQTKPYFPKDGSVYDYNLFDCGFMFPTGDDSEVPTWVNWMNNIEKYEVPPECNFGDIEVPTMDSVRSAAILGLKLHNYNNVLCVGATGTGKTVTVTTKLSDGIHKKFICDFLVFSARTSANQTQDIIDSKLDRRKRGVYGPPVTKRQIFFIDDLNMPALEVYGAQPPIELLRQYMDFSGWYDLRNIGDFRRIIDTNIVCAMGPPGGGRNLVTMRLLRHFHYIAFTEMEYSSKVRIFGTILSSWTSKISEHVSSQDAAILSASLRVFSTLVQELLPTPTKSHYTFNLRDLSKLFQGMLMMDPTSVKDEAAVIRLWYHEHQRVYEDRLVNEQDTEWFRSLLKSNLAEEFGVQPESILRNRLMLFGDFMDTETDEKKYVEIPNMEELVEVLQTYLREYNALSTAPMSLVLFSDAVQHVCRVARVVRQPAANALLLGVGGSGRQSLTRLAAHMAELIYFQIELTRSYGASEWRDDLKSAMMKCSIENRGTVFMFDEAQIKMESFLEDLNNILSSGDVPNIYDPDDLDKIYHSMRHAVSEAGRAPTKSNLFAAHQKRVRNNLHLVISMSPIGDIFRSRLRQFPSLVNCCTIDWYREWPESALQSVARQYLGNMTGLGASDDVMAGMVKTCCFIHQNVVDSSTLFLHELNRLNYVTPMSYIEMLATYAEMFTKKREENILESSTLKKGLEKLNQTEVEVKELQIELAELKPLMETAAEETRAVIDQIDIDSKIAEEARIKLEVEQAVAEKMGAETEVMAADAQKDLDAALPALEAAERALRALNRNDIVEVKAMKKPPVGVVLVIQSLCIVFDIKPLKLPGAKFGEKILDYWKPGSLMLTDPTAFLESLMNFDKESITEAMVKTLKRFIADPNFEPSKVLRVSKACQSLCMWVHAIYKYYHVNKAVAPKKEALNKAKAELAAVEDMIAVANEKMQTLIRGIAKLHDYLKEKEEERQRMEEEIGECMARMDRAVRLLNGLSSERTRWINKIKELDTGIVNLIGDVLLNACAVGYITPFTDSYRRKMLQEWQRELTDNKVPHSDDCSPITILGEAILIRSWQLQGLPRDLLSVESAVLMANSRRWPLVIDPQLQANKWIRAMGKIPGLLVCKPSDRDLLRSFESALRFGKPLLMENVGEYVDPSLDPVLKRQYYKQAGQLVLKLGDSVIPYTSGFQLYMTTKLTNPRYRPEVAVKVQLVNFALVPSGLTEQLLSYVVSHERPELEERRGQLVVSLAQAAAQVQAMQTTILHALSASAAPVDDVELITTLEASRVKSQEITIKVVDMEKTQITIEEILGGYLPIATRGQILFFCLSGLAAVDPMYQYSLEWFVKLFVKSMADTEPDDEIFQRVEMIVEHFTFSLYTNVCRSLFARHKLHFAFLLCARVLTDKGAIDMAEYNFLLNGAKPVHTWSNPDPSWITNKIWSDLLELASLPSMSKFVETFGQYLSHHRSYYDSKDVYRMPLPKPFENTLNAFQKLLIVKCVRPDKLSSALQDYTTVSLGSRFVEPYTPNIAELYKESEPAAPVIFVLSAGTDPAADLMKFASKQKMAARLEVVSLGQGQGARAESLLRIGAEFGNWLFLQNCHLAPSWMSTLEMIVEQLSPESIHKDFRLWLTSMPSPAFPVSLLQNGFKITVEPPRGIKANLLTAYSNQVLDFSDVFQAETEKTVHFKWFLFSLCLFHGVVLERRKFGPLGFNIPYEFTDGDLRICISQLHMYLNESDEVPLKMLTFVTGHINYGGRVTDDWDRRCLLTLLADYYNMAVLSDKYVFDDTAASAYRQLPASTVLSDYTAYLKSLPLNDDPGLFGLHSNANITYAQAESQACLETLRLLQPRGSADGAGGEGDDGEGGVWGRAREMLRVLPEALDEDSVAVKFPVSYKESLNTVLQQEVMRFNKLLFTIRTSLSDLLKALKGSVVMSESLESMSQSLAENAVPELWRAKAYPSLKPLGAWMSDLRERVSWLVTWSRSGAPRVFWLPGLYFPQAFLTATMQNYARKYAIAIDSIGFGFEFLNSPPENRITDGSAIRGLFLEGARWNTRENVLEESKLKELYTEMCIIVLRPEQGHRMSASAYECPLYKTLKRAGTLSTTGHSTNFVTSVELTTNKSGAGAHWVKRGVALFCALDY